MEFNREYQLHLISRLMTKEGKEIVEHVHEAAFDEDLQPIVKEQLKSWAKYKKPLTRAQIAQKLGGGTLPNVTGSPVEVDLEEVQNFDRCMKFRGVLLQASQFLMSGDIGYAKGLVSEFMMRDAGRNEHQAGEIFTSVKEFKSRVNPMSTGIDQIDDCLYGGVCAGEAAAVMAVSGGGKSMWLVHVGAHAILQKKNVFHVSLEMPLGTMRERYMSRLGLGEMGVRKAKKKSQEWGRSMIYCASPSTIRMQDVRRQIDVCGFRPDVIILDSVENIRCVKPFGERWAEEESIMQEFKALVEDLECAGWTCFQANRPGYGRQLIGMDNCKGSMDKIRLSDFVMSINQDENEMIADPDNGKCLGRLYVAKNRHGPKGVVVRTEIDWFNCMFESAEERGNYTV